MPQHLYHAFSPPAFVLLFVFSLSSAHTWAAGDSEWFAALNLSVGDVTIDNISHHGTIGTGAPFGNSIDGQLQDDEIDDVTAGIGFTLGRRFGYWNISGEFIWRYRTDWDIAATTYSLQTITNVFTNIETSTAMLNATRRGPISQHWSWELGAGVGLVNNKLKSEYIEREVPGVAPERKVRDNSSHTEFSYNIYAGVSRDLGGPWTLTIRYRYIDLGELQTGPFPERPAKIDADYSSRELLFTLERDF